MSLNLEKTRTLAVTLGALVLGLTGVGTVLAPTASAARAYPVCNTTISVDKGTYILLRVPYDSLHPDGVACSLMYGDTGGGVKGLQQLLNTCYGKNLVEDGRFGDRTRAALRSVQTTIGADPDGIYGPQTAGMIKKRAASTATGQPIACRVS
ncbi:peptidoglycan-binding protein [Streptomyces sp. NPDC018693]|uniref:peptidoglycan-binding domain-containing protein n=1 Tax=unclassified Streptomyces TaxID=2593676 RepID=UPI0037980369